ncbi:MAG TPA: prepilin-type N-terminal cleavage/methylation domain-containing protein, partial [Gemmatimonadaceae bacterium]
MTRHRFRAGFTLIELLISMVLLMAILAITVKTFKASSTLLAGQSGRLEAMQNARFGLTELDRDLRVAGVGVLDIQPLLVEASNTAIVFNVDLISKYPGDVGSVYVDTSADSNATNSMLPTNPIVLPGLAVNYPPQSYTANGVLSGAETISYYLNHDSSSALSTEYLLYRQVNATKPEVIARGIQYNSATDTVFQYFKTDTVGNLTLIPKASLPLRHNAATHGAANDTGKYALIDSITMVKVTLKAVYHDPKTGKDAIRRIQSTVRLLNAGLIHRTTCGDPPLAVATPTAVTSLAGATTPFVKLSWTHAIDDGGGEKDIQSYAIFRRPDSVATFDQPFASVPAGSSTYNFTDTNVSS